jgi:hypothetical protein
MRLVQIYFPPLRVVVIARLGIDSHIKAFPKWGNPDIVPNHRRFESLYDPKLLPEKIFHTAGLVFFQANQPRSFY